MRRRKSQKDNIKDAIKAASATLGEPLNRRQLGEHVARLISDERNATHGDPHFQFACAQDLKGTFEIYSRNERSTSTFNRSTLESADMILTKLSRIACGSNLQDHWLDIAGYALIAAEAAEKPL